jgi:hypothetical protein
MSALGQKQTFAAQNVMFALPPNVGSNLPPIIAIIGGCNDRWCEMDFY